MKMMNKILGLLLLSVFFMSCGDDEDKEPLKEVEKQITHSFEQTLKGFKDAEQGYNATIRLDDVLPSESKGLIKASFSTGNNSFEVRGFTQAQPTLELRNFTVTVGTQPFNLGTCKVGGLQTQNEFAPDQVYDNETAVALSQAIYNGLVSKEKQASIKISFTANEDFTGDNVKLILKIGGRYSYWVLDNTAK